MNGSGGGVVGGKKINGTSRKGGKEVDEDLVLFREMHKREKTISNCLLDPLPNDFEPNGNYTLYKMASAKKGAGVEFLAENEKNDYDWLKTPPATPLFPSLEMEANANNTNGRPEMVLQREIKILHPLSKSRFSGNSSEATKTSSGRCKSPTPKPSFPPRSTGRPSISSLGRNNKHPGTTSDQKKNQFISTDLNDTNKNITNSLSSRNNTEKATSHSKSNKQPSIRGVSPQVRPTIPAQLPAFSNETPPNLRTSERASSVSRRNSHSGINNNNRTASSSSNPQKQEPDTRSISSSRRQSCSPSVARGRKVESNAEVERNTVFRSNIIQSATGDSVSSQSHQVMGSRMVDKFLSARKSSAAERDIKGKLNTSVNESSGFGRMMIMSTSSDKVLTHVDIRKEEAKHIVVPYIARKSVTGNSFGAQLGAINGRKFTR